MSKTFLCLKVVDKKKTKTIPLSQSMFKCVVCVLAWVGNIIVMVPVKYHNKDKK